MYKLNLYTRVCVKPCIKGPMCNNIIDAKYLGFSVWLSHKDN